ncbi:MAG: hypothetical protein ACREQA_24295 [Candidatus Binatia bacterium]
MGAYEVGRLIFDLRKESGLAKEFGGNPEVVMERYRLTEEEKKAFRNKDIKFIYQLGVNPYLIIGAGGPLGLERAELLLALADAGPHPTERTTTYPGPSPAVHERLKKMAAGAVKAYPSQMTASGTVSTTSAQKSGQRP